ncbi:MAG: hypothetical protein IKQ05_05315 [Prevotella sp.]|jgi:hypothetical protein|nr:hypothetical protein [Prevotella sp.]
MKQLTIVILLLWASVGPVGAQTVSWQTAINDSVFLNVSLSYSASPKPEVRLQKAYITRRGSLHREPVKPSRLHYDFGKGAATSFQFSMNFTYQKHRYRAQGRYVAGGDDGTKSQLRCVPMRLSDKTLIESEYQDYPR